MANNRRLSVSDKFLLIVDIRDTVVKQVKCEVVECLLHIFGSICVKNERVGDYKQEAKKEYKAATLYYQHAHLLVLYSSDSDLLY